MEEANISQDALFREIDNRIALDREDGDVAYFNALMLKLEFLTKVVVAGVVACIDDDIDRNRYTLEHELVRADSLGNWAETLNTALVGPPAQSLLPIARTVFRDLTERVRTGDWRHAAVKGLVDAASVVGIEVDIGETFALRRFFEIAAQIRNGTRGHGATTATQCHNACPSLQSSLDAVVRNMEIFQVPWVYLHQNLSGKHRVLRLLNDPAPFDYLKKTRDAKVFNGVHLDLEGETSAFNPLHVGLVFTDADLQDIYLPNGNFKRGSFEALSYATNKVDEVDGSRWSDPPARLPESETEGSPELGTIRNVFTNTPFMPSGYVKRAHLEKTLIDELEKVDRHSIITLTGPGGIGKTTLAIRAIYAVSERESPPYEVVVWISARDIDLLDEGPKPVARKVFTQRDISRAAVDQLKPDGHNRHGFKAEEYFQECLTNGAAGPTLFVLDNFETLQNPIDVFEWLDAHIRNPNKILITTRFREFRGDYPIQIKGMSDDEANALIDQHASRLDIRKLVSTNYRRELISESDGHPYVIKILLGQAAKAGKALKPKRIVATSDHLLNALFRRTYDSLSTATQRVFLLLSSWRSYVPEVAVEAVSLRPGNERFDVAGSLEELVQYSLVDYVESKKDNQRFLAVPLVAAMFGKRELNVSSFKTAVEEDRKLLMEFGPGRRESSDRGTIPRIENLINGIARRIRKNPTELDETMPVLEYLASRFPTIYLRLADLVLQISASGQSVERAKGYLRNYLGAAESVEKSKAWKRLADLCEQSGDTVGEVHAFCEVALLPNTSASVIGEIANRLNSRIRDLKQLSIEDAWSGEVRELLMKVIQEMERRKNELSATHMSRLAWLHLNVGNPDRALDVARLGLEKDPSEHHCQRLIEKLQ